MTISRRLALVAALATLFANALAAAHAWRFTHFVETGEKTASPEQLSTVQRFAVALSGVTVPRPENRRFPGDVGLSAAESGVGDIATWTIDGAGRGTVLLFHGYGGSKSDNLDEARVFHDAGYTTVLVDFPGSGGSRGNVTTLGWQEAEVVRALAAEVDGPLVLFGKSMGAAAALRAVGSLGTRADALVLENPYDQLLTTVAHRFEAMGLPDQPGAALLTLWGGALLGYNGFAMNPVDFAPAVTARTLLLHGEHDPRVRVDEVESIQRQLGGPSELVVFPGAGHAGLYAADPARWRDAVTGFLAR